MSFHHLRYLRAAQGSGKELIQPVLDNQLKAASPLVLPPRVSE
jgi:20S proteasome subunit beta 6